MKNLFFVLAFMLIGTFAVANNSIEKVATPNVEEAVEMINSLEFDYDAFTLEAEESVGTCTITLTFIGQDGEELGSVVLVITGVGSAAECDQIADDLGNML